LKKVSIIKDWKFPDILRQTPGSSGIWEDIQFLNVPSHDADLLIVLNRPHIDITAKFQNGGAWLFSQESPIDMYQWHTRSFRYFDRVYTFWDHKYGSNIIHEQTSLPWHINKTYDQLMGLKKSDLGNKQDKLSWVTSNASSKQGHHLRLSFLDHLNRSALAFDLFGKGFQFIEDKFDGIFPYKYSIAIENYSCDHYWTEKIADCYLSWTMPIYYGAMKILDYFPKESLLLIDPADPETSIAEVKRKMADNYWEKNLSAIEEARELILNKYQFFPNIASKIKSFTGSTRKKKYYIIPANMPGEEMQTPSKVISKKVTFKLRSWLK
jgi:hypothetical protein